jgi:hypothetical protein
VTVFISFGSAFGLFSARFSVILFETSFITRLHCSNPHLGFNLANQGFPMAQEQRNHFSKTIPINQPHFIAFLRAFEIP